MIAPRGLPVRSGYSDVAERQKPMSLGLVEFPVPTVAVKLEDDSVVRIGLPAIEAAVRIDLGGASPHRVVASSCWVGREPPCVAGSSRSRML